MLAVLVLVSLALVTVDFRTEDGPVDGLRGLATRVFGPLQSGASDVVAPVARFFGNVGDLASTFEENDALRDQVAALEERRRAVEAIEAENDELRNLLDMAAGADWDTVTSRAIAIGPSNYEWTITIDVGTDDGVAEDMPVVDGDGLVGKVVLADRSTSRVLLTIDSNFASAAKLADSGEIGDVGGRGSELLQFELVDPDVTVEAGDVVVTSAYQYGVFPAGIPIGVVEVTDEARTELTRSVRVRPYVDFTSLGTLLVLRTVPEVVPPEIPRVPARDLDPPQLVPDPTPEPSPSPSPTEAEGGA